MPFHITYHAYLIVLLYGVAELGLTLKRRASQQATHADQGTLKLIWIINSIALGLALLLERRLDFADIGFFQDHHNIGIAVLLAGVLLRIYAIVHLGRFFTVNVAIADDHRVIDSGPYRWLRHPSYTGVLLISLGFGLCLANWVGLLIIMLPTTATLLWRITVEERALHAGLGAAYTSYAQHTWRLLPFIY